LPRTGVGQAYFEVYPPPAAKGAEPVKLTMRLRLFDAPAGRAEGRFGRHRFERTGQTRRQGDSDRASDCRFAAIPVGAYRAEITVKDSVGGEASRSVQFRVE
jgi:hypothetical protein